MSEQLRMSTPRTTERERSRAVPEKARAQLLDGLPVKERRLELAAISTPVLEGGDGPPILLLHDPAQYAAKWWRVIPDLVRTHRVVAPDLPGHGASEVGKEPLDAARTLAWVGELIDRTCATPPVVVGLILGGAIAARFAAEHGDRLRALVLVDSLGLAPLQPAPEFARAMDAFFTGPSEETHAELWRYCAFDLERLQDRLGDRWAPFAAYNLDRAQTPSVQAALHALMEAFAYPSIPPQTLERISVPTALIWGRHDLATRLEVAEGASARYAWPLHVIEEAADDPPIEQPEAFLEALRAELARI